MAGDAGQQDGGRSELQDMQSQVNQALARLSGPGELLIALAGALIVFVEVFGGWIADDYFLGDLGWIVGVFILLAVGLHRFGGMELPVAYGSTLAVLALAIGLLAVRDLVLDLRFEVLDNGGMTIFFALLTYAAGVVALVGAWQVWRSTAR